MIPTVIPTMFMTLPIYNIIEHLMNNEKDAPMIVSWQAGQQKPCYQLEHESAFTEILQILAEVLVNDPWHPLLNPDCATPSAANNNVTGPLLASFIFCLIFHFNCRLSFLFGSNFNWTSS